MRIDSLLTAATQKLQQAGSPSSRRDAEVLLCHVLGVGRAWLYTWGDRQVDEFVQARFDDLIVARVAGEPVAYLTGEREFWGLSLDTSSATLIPRPDTETLVEVALEKAREVGEAPKRLLDLGTGTGAIALAFASEYPGWQVVGVDLNETAVLLARNNAKKNAIVNVEFLVSDWFSALGRDSADSGFALIVSNPPYLADDDPHLSEGDVRFEPHSALVAAEQGLADLRYLVQGARQYLAGNGWLLLEHGMQQGAAVRQALSDAGFVDVASYQDLGSRERVSLGRWQPCP
ncbi:peptide chain release factor N(5)-glutamine methyltransferase [Halomonas halocynthiae]|uniref:peptide chain release factor N(5)-glutamine methyltransferase n=1 Tax=Halomonas halocynthiae TaxID=176290 RepID=UPI00042791E0|nr:peptide chain release factor N(5)-glutamine methyltransferase [Halomonas halocynthiae]